MRRLMRLCVVLLFFKFFAHGKIFGRCELARKLSRLGAENISTWVCIAVFTSGLNSSAISGTSRSPQRAHGIFQIADRYWCSPPGEYCGIDCTNLRDDEITDDWECVEKIFEEKARKNGNGFQAWNPIYADYCKEDTSNYLRNCNLEKTNQIPSQSKPTTTDKQDVIPNPWYRIKAVPIQDTIQIA